MFSQRPFVSPLYLIVVENGNYCLYTPPRNFVYTNKTPKILIREPLLIALPRDVTNSLIFTEAYTETKTSYLHRCTPHYRN